jgi:hypothetical protein
MSTANQCELGPDVVRAVQEAKYAARGGWLAIVYVACAKLLYEPGEPDFVALRTFATEDEANGFAKPLRFVVIPFCAPGPLDGQKVYVNSLRELRERNERKGFDAQAVAIAKAREESK